MSWLHTLWFDYVWPSCTGNGPESIIEMIVGVVVWQKLLGPRLKAWHARSLADHHESIKAHIAAELAKIDKSPSTRTQPWRFTASQGNGLRISSEALLDQLEPPEVVADE